MAQSFARMAQPADLVLLISLDGESEDVLKIAEYLRLNQIPSVSITKMKMNSLSLLCNENLYIHSLKVPEEYGVNYEITTPYFILIEMLFIEYQKYMRYEHIPTK